MNDSICVMQIVELRRWNIIINPAGLVTIITCPIGVPRMALWVSGELAIVGKSYVYRLLGSRRWETKTNGLKCLVLSQVAHQTKVEHLLEIRSWSDLHGAKMEVGHDFEL